MKLGFIADNHLEGVDHDCRFARNHGYVGLEFNHWGGFADLERGYIEQVKQTLDANSIECSTLGMWGFNPISADSAEREKHLGLVDKLIEFGAILGAPVLICGGGRVADDLDANIAEFARVMRPKIDAAAERGLKIALYGFHGGSFLQSVEAYVKLFEAVPDVGIKYDPANIDHAGCDYIQALRAFADRVYHVHIKEHLNHAGQVASQPAAGMGDIHFGKVLAFLYEADYRGYLTVEPHGSKWGRPPLREKMLILTRKHLDQFLLG